MDTGPEVEQDNSMNPTYNEVISVLRQQLGEAQFQVQLLSITNEKLRQRIAELESEDAADEEAD